MGFGGEPARRRPRSSMRTRSTVGGTTYARCSANRIIAANHTANGGVGKSYTHNSVYGTKITALKPAAHAIVSVTPYRISQHQIRGMQDRGPRDKFPCVHFDAAKLGQTLHSGVFCPYQRQQPTSRRKNSRTRIENGRRRRCARTPAAQPGNAPVPACPKPLQI